MECDEKIRLKFVFLYLSKFETSDYDYPANFDESMDRRTLYDNNRRGQQNFNFHGNNRRLRLEWEERGKSLRYTLRVDGSRRGFWISAGLQKGKYLDKCVESTDHATICQVGTMLDLPYNQFTGTVQVMKAVGNHLVLTFCESLPKSQIFTIILTRKLHMLSRDVSD